MLSQRNLLPLLSCQLRLSLATVHTAAMPPPPGRPPGHSSAPRVSTGSYACMTPRLTIVGSLQTGSHPGHPRPATCLPISQAVNWLPCSLLWVSTRHRGSQHKWPCHSTHRTVAFSHLPLNHMACRQKQNHWPNRGSWEQTQPQPRLAPAAWPFQECSGIRAHCLGPSPHQGSRPRKAGLNTQALVLGSP